MSKAATVIAHPLWTNTNHRIDIAFYSDVKKRTRKSISGSTVKVVVGDPSTATYSYTATAISASRGTCYITLTGTNHTTAGTASFQVRVDGITKEAFTGDFKAKL